MARNPAGNRENPRLVRSREIESVDHVPSTTLHAPFAWSRESCSSANEDPRNQASNEMRASSGFLVFTNSGRMRFAWALPEPRNGMGSAAARDLVSDQPNGGRDLGQEVLFALHEESVRVPVPRVGGARVDFESLGRCFRTDGVRVVVALGRARRTQMDHGAVTGELGLPVDAKLCGCCARASRPIGKAVERTAIT